MTRPIPHGTYKGYRLHRCRQQCCIQAAYRYTKTMRVKTALGTWNPWGDTAQARAHLLMLYSRGWNAKTLARRIGHDAITIRRLIHRPDQRKRRIITEAIMRVRLDEIPEQVAAYRITRRLRALARHGWSLSDLAQEFGSGEAALSRIRQGKDATTKRSIAEPILQGYDQLRDAPSPSPQSGRVRATAMARGWLSDTEWDGLIDLPPQELDLELARQVALLEPEDLSASRTAHRVHGDRSVLIVAASYEYERREHIARKERNRRGPE